MPSDLFSNGDRQHSEQRIVAEYDYRGLDGELRYQVCRLEPKRFLQRRKHEGRWVWGLTSGYYLLRDSGCYTRVKGGESREGSVHLERAERVLYRLPEMQHALADNEWIIVCEGEKDADAGAHIGLATTTSPGGAGTWQAAYSKSIRGARVAIVPDNDDPGRRGAEKAAKNLYSEAAEVRLVDLGGSIKGFDLTDWIRDHERLNRTGREIHSRFSELLEETPTWSPDETELSQRPLITATTKEMEVVDQAIEALTNRHEIFQRGGCLVQIVQDRKQADGITRPSQPPTIEPVAPARVREVLSAAAVWENLQGKEIHPPKWVVDTLMARRQWSGVRVLEGVAETPVLRPDGSIAETAGYDDQTGWYLMPSDCFPPIPRSPTRRDAETAFKSLLEAVCDFPFEEPAHRAAWVAAILSILGRPAFRGPIPLFLIDANVRGAGKSLLADVTSGVTLGRDAPRMAPAESDAEERKRITALMLAGDPLILIDNVSGELGSSSLDAALTGPTWTDRLLGQNTRVVLPLRAVWIATGNNVVLRGDTCRRVLPIRLDSHEEFPEKRQGFRHPHLLDWVARQRSNLVVAGLTILKAYILAGKPARDLEPWGSFERWSSLIRGAVVWSGLPDPLSARCNFVTDGDRERDLLERLLEGWNEATRISNKPLSAKEVLQLLQEHGDDRLAGLRCAVCDLCSTADELPSPRSLGNRLVSFRDRVVGGKALRRSGRSKFGATWTVEQRRGDSSDSGDSPGSSSRETHTSLTD